MADQDVFVMMSKRMLLDQVMLIRSKLDMETREGREAASECDALLGMVHASQTDAAKRNYPRIGHRRL